MSDRKRYASGTTVDVSKSRAELEGLLKKHGASQWAVFQDDAKGMAVVQFRISERLVRLKLRVERSVLNPNERDWGKSQHAPQGWNSWTVQRRKEWIAKENEQAEREAWRRLILVTKGKLEFVADGLSTIEREFLADIMLPNGTTVGEFTAPQLTEAYESGRMPPLLPGVTE